MVLAQSGRKVCLIRIGTNLALRMRGSMLCLLRCRDRFEYRDKEERIDVDTFIMMPIRQAIGLNKAKMLVSANVVGSILFCLVRKSSTADFTVIVPVPTGQTGPYSGSVESALSK